MPFLHAQQSHGEGNRPDSSWQGLNGERVARQARAKEPPSAVHGIQVEQLAPGGRLGRDRLRRHQLQISQQQGGGVEFEFEFHPGAAACPARGHLGHNHPTNNTGCCCCSVKRQSGWWWCGNGLNCCIMKVLSTADIHTQQAAVGTCADDPTHPNAARKHEGRSGSADVTPTSCCSSAYSSGVGSGSRLRGSTWAQERMQVLKPSCYI